MPTSSQGAALPNPQKPVPAQTIGSALNPTVPIFVPTTRRSPIAPVEIWLRFDPKLTHREVKRQVFNGREHLLSTGGYNSKPMQSHEALHACETYAAAFKDPHVVQRNGMMLFTLNGAWLHPVHEQQNLRAACFHTTRYPRSATGSFGNHHVPPGLMGTAGGRPSICNTGLPNSGAYVNSNHFRGDFTTYPSSHATSIKQSSPNFVIPSPSRGVTIRSPNERAMSAPQLQSVQISDESPQSPALSTPPTSTESSPKEEICGRIDTRETTPREGSVPTYNVSTIAQEKCPQRLMRRPILDYLNDQLGNSTRRDKPALQPTEVGGSSGIFTPIASLQGVIPAPQAPRESAETHELRNRSGISSQEPVLHNRRNGITAKPSADPLSTERLHCNGQSRSLFGREDTAIHSALRHPFRYPVWNSRRPSIPDRGPKSNEEPDKALNNRPLPQLFVSSPILSLSAQFESSITVPSRDSQNRRCVPATIDGTAPNPGELWGPSPWNSGNPTSATVPPRFSSNRGEVTSASNATDSPVIVPWSLRSSSTRRGLGGFAEFNDELTLRELSLNSKACDGPPARNLGPIHRPWSGPRYEDLYD